MPHFQKKKSRPPMDLVFFCGFPPKIFFIYHWYPNETWYTCSLLTWLYDVLVFYPNFEKKIISPPMDLAFLCVVSRPKLFHHQWYPNETWYMPTHYQHGFMKFWFLTQFWKNNFPPPPRTSNFFVVST